MIYLDHAATSFPKPPQVLDAVREWFTSLGVSADRGDGRAAATVRERVAGVRQRLATACGVAADRVVFTSGATESLNAFLFGFLGPGDAVLTTALEHSSLVRPLAHLRDTAGVAVEVLAPDADGRVSAARFAAALAARRFRLVAFSHASNVLGTVLDAAAICAAAHAHGAATLLDASATAGLLPLDVGADAVAASAHKSLLAPPGLGFLAVRAELEVRPTRFGGTGSSRALATQPAEWPTAMESGTPNTPAILGLSAALDFLAAEGPGPLLAAELALIDEMRAGLRGIATVLGDASGPRIPVLSFTVDGLDPAEAGLLLDAAGIHVRTGFHCAPLLHEHLGTAAGGTVRASVGPFNRAGDVRAVRTALAGG